MTEKKKGWKWWQRVALVALVAGPLVFLLLCLSIGSIKPWIEPLPGVRVTSTRPLVRESDLGPDSAYRLMLEAIRPPAKLLPQAAVEESAELFLPEPDPETGWPPPPAPEPEPIRIWDRHWSDALTKFKHHPWPAEPPRTEPGEGEFASVSSLSPEAPWTRGQYEDILRLNRHYGPQIALLDRALAAPDPQMPLVESYDVELPYRQDVREMARWLAVSAHCRAGTGDFAGAFRDFERILGLGNLVCRGGDSINHLMATACQATAADVAWIIASREQVPAPVLRDAARAFLTAHDGAEPFAEAIRIDRVIFSNTMRKTYRDKLDHHPLLETFMERKSPSFEAFYQHLVVLAEKPYTPATAADYRDLHDRLEVRNTTALLVSVLRARSLSVPLLAGMLLPSHEGTHLRVTHRDAILRGMALYLAVLAYETEHGEPPENLDTLVPDYLPRVPEDPFDGQPFRYLRRNVPGLPPEAWAVYSIGENFTDDGGTAHGAGTHSRVSGTSSRCLPNPDFVWPSVNYPKAGEE